MTLELKDIQQALQGSFDDLKKMGTRQEDEIKKFGQVTEETKTQIGKINDEMTKFQNQINELAKKQANFSTGGANPMSEEEKKKADIFYKYMREGKGELTREEKALVEDATGDIIVPYDVDKEIYRQLTQTNALRGLAQVRPTTSDRIRRINMNELTVGWGKLETTAKKLAEFESTLVPSEQYAYVEDAYGLTKIGEDELEDSDINLQAYLADSFTIGMANLEEKGFLRGTGHSTQQPEGILSKRAAVDIVGRTTTPTIALKADDLINLSYAAPSQAAKNGVYLIHRQIELAMRLMKDTQGQYLWQPSLQAGTPATFNGKAVHLSDEMDSTIAANKEVAIFGDFNAGYQILDRKQGFITRINELYLNDGLIGFRYKRRVGGYVRRPEMLKVLKISAT